MEPAIVRAMACLTVCNLIISGWMVDCQPSFTITNHGDHGEWMPWARRAMIDNTF